MTEDIGDDIREGWLTVVVVAVIIKRLVLRRNQRPNIGKGNALKVSQNVYSQGEVSTYFILAHSRGDKLWGAGGKPRRLGDGIHITPSSGWRRAAAVDILQGFALLFRILKRTRTQSFSATWRKITNPRRNPSTLVVLFLFILDWLRFSIAYDILIFSCVALTSGNFKYNRAMYYQSNVETQLQAFFFCIVPTFHTANRHSRQKIYEQDVCNFAEKKNAFYNSKYALYERCPFLHI